jgi:hypothetical protein
MMSSMNGGAKVKSIPFNGFSGYLISDGKITLIIDRKHYKQLKNLEKELYPFSKKTETVIEEFEEGESDDDYDL